MEKKCSDSELYLSPRGKYEGSVANRIINHQTALYRRLCKISLSLRRRFESAYGLGNVEPLCGLSNNQAGFPEGLPFTGCAQGS